MKANPVLVFLKALKQVTSVMKHNFTDIKVSIPQLDESNFHPLVWCPRMIKEKE